MSAPSNRNTYNLVLLGNTLITRMRREIRRFDPFSKEALSLRPVVQALEELRRTLENFDRQWKDEAVPVAPSIEGAQQIALSAGFHTALTQIDTPADDVLLMDQDDHVDQASALGYRGGVFKVPDVMLHLSLFHKSGVLKIKGPDETIEIEIVDGDVVNAFSDNTPPGMRLGEILVAQGAVEARELEAFHTDHHGDRRRLGESLKNEEVVTHGQIVEALKFQFQNLFVRCFRMKFVTISFKPDHELEAPRELRLDVVSLLMEGSPSSKG